MNHGYLDRFARGSSPLHRLSAETKMAAALLLVVLTAFIGVPLWPVLAAEALVVVFLVAASGIPAGFFLKRLLLFEPLMIGAAVVGFLSPGGWLKSGVLLVRSNLAVSVMILLANTTPFSEILRVLRRLGVPALFLTVLSLMYRYLYLVIDQAERMERARRSRTFSGRQAKSWRVWSGLVAMLFVRSTERAERIYAAMLARGWR
jgi:cobalt/nickel transport system permease protein